MMGMLPHLGHGGLHGDPGHSQNRRTLLPPWEARSPTTRGIVVFHRISSLVRLLRASAFLHGY